MVPQVTTRAQDPPRSYELLARKVATSPYGGKRATAHGRFGPS
jgi:hypothetical protein